MKKRDFAEKVSDEITTIIRPNRNGAQVSKIIEIWRARDLILLFVKRDFTTLYKQTILGPIWFLIQPLLTTLVFSVIFGRIAKIPTDGIPPNLFYLSGIVVWTYFSSCVEKNSTIFVENQALFSKVYFPRLAIPIATAITNIFTFSIQFATFLSFLAYYKLNGADLPISWFAILLTPIIIMQVAILGVGIGLIVSALTTKYRDLAFTVGFGIQLWMYATPIVYPLSEASPKLQTILSLNPMSGPVELFRHIYMGSSLVSVNSVLIGAAVTFLIFLVGINLFGNAEKNSMDTV